MTALILHIIWSIAYIIIFLLSNIIIVLLYNDNIIKLKQHNNNFFIKLILLIFFNKNLSFYKNLLNDDEIYKLELNRLKNWPTINFIHSNINKLSIKNNNIINITDFKQQYKNFKFVTNELNINNLINISNADNKIIFSSINLIIKDNYKNLNKFNYSDLLVSLFIFKNSISTDIINVKSYNLLKFNDYINYINNTTLEKNFYKTQLIINEQNNNNNFKYNINLNNYKIYNKFQDVIEFSNNYFYLKIFNKYLNLNTEFNNNFITDLKQKYLISFSASNIVKYISDFSVNNSTILYLRKNKIFNKSRYSRNRQTYRTGAYWCLYVNIVAVVAFYFWFYKFTMNFGYLWWLLFTLIASFFFSRALKHNFYNPVKIYLEFILGFKWFILILCNIIKPILNCLLLSTNKYTLNFIVRLNQNLTYFDLINEKSILANYLFVSFTTIDDINEFVYEIIHNK